MGISDEDFRKAEEVNSNLDKYNAVLSINSLRIPGDELNNIKSNGNYIVYITKSSSDEKFLAGCLIFLEVREIRIAVYAQLLKITGLIKQQFKYKY